MGLMKKDCRFIVKGHPGFRLHGVLPAWETHPSLILGIEALDEYTHWVSEVVMPIAFQWIEEHKAEVYKDVPKDRYDDMGVVIASAFDIVKTLPAYQASLKEAADYEDALKHGTWDGKTVNQSWQNIVRKVRKETKEAFEEEGHLNETKP